MILQSKSIEIIEQKQCYCVAILYLIEQQQYSTTRKVGKRKDKMLYVL